MLEIIGYAFSIIFLGAAIAVALGLVVFGCTLGISLGMKLLEKWGGL